MIERPLPPRTDQRLSPLTIEHLEHDIGGEHDRRDEAGSGVAAPESDTHGQGDDADDQADPAEDRGPGEGRAMPVVCPNCSPGVTSSLVSTGQRLFAVFQIVVLIDWAGERRRA